MRTMRDFGLAGALAAALAVGGAALAQEHPEHPEHPKEHPGKKEGVGKEALGTAIREWVKKDSALHGGRFLVWDEKAKKPLSLTLEKVHDDKLARIRDDVYFACADFKEDGGATYDLDIFMSGKSASDLAPTEVTVHKENGKERYGWVEEGGVWKRKDAK